MTNTGNDTEIGTSPWRKPKRTWRRRLRSEPWRHVIAVVVAAFLANVLTMTLVFTETLGVGRSEDAFEFNVMAPAALSVFTFYGPVYFLLSNYAWRKLSGQQLRTALQRTAPPEKGIVRRLLVSSPTQISSTAALLSLAAVYLVAIRPGAPMAILLISLACVAGSWILVMASFSVEYAREWANSDGFEFSGNDELTYSDFIYLATQASTTYSSSDVTAASRRARKLVTTHAITAFVFTTVILAFLVALVLNTIAG